MTKKTFAFLAVSFIIAVKAATAGGTDSSKVLTQDELNLMVSYLQKGSIPALADSVTLASVQSLKSKIDSVLTKKKQLRSLVLTPHEGNVVLYFMRPDLSAAMALLRLQQKLQPAARETGPEKKKK